MSGIATRAELVETNNLFGASSQELECHAYIVAITKLQHSFVFDLLTQEARVGKVIFKLQTYILQTLGNVPEDQRMS